jgi:hypothetical protein
MIKTGLAIIGGLVTMYVGYEGAQCIKAVVLNRMAR